MTLTELRYVVALAQERHFGRAAQKCFVTQPTLSLALAKLEDELGVKLFERNKNELLNYLTKSLPSVDDEELGKKSLERELYRGNPYGHPVQGTVAGVQALTLDDVKSFYREHYTFENLQIGLAGGLPELNGGDGLALVINNAAANKLDVYLERSVAYDATFDPATGHVTGTVTVVLTNTARPVDGLGTSLLRRLVERERG